MAEDDKIRIDGLSKAYGGFQALEGLSSRSTEVRCSGFWARTARARPRSSVC